MKWSVVARPQALTDIIRTAEWYDGQSAGLGDEFVEEILTVFDALELSPLLNCRQHPTKNIRWRFPKRFPYRVIYEVIEADQLVIIAAVLHAARSDSNWRSRYLRMRITSLRPRSACASFPSAGSTRQ